MLSSTPPQADVEHSRKSKISRTRLGLRQKSLFYRSRTMQQCTHLFVSEMGWKRSHPSAWMRFMRSCSLQRCNKSKSTLRGRGGASCHRSTPCHDIQNDFAYREQIMENSTLKRAGWSLIPSGYSLTWTADTKS